MIDPLLPSTDFQRKSVRDWLQLIEPVEQLWNAVLEVVHPDMSEANSKAVGKLLQDLGDPPPTWPTTYPAIDVIANRRTPKHCDKGGAPTLYDHLASFGQDHEAELLFPDFDAEFAYKPGTSVFFPGKALAHLVPEWTEGKERVVMAHYLRDAVQNKLELARPSLPTQLGWPSRYI
jgi:hypothetical protein